VDERWQQSLREDIMDARVPVHGTLVERDISLREVAALKAGDIIPVDLPEEFILQANGVPVFRGKMGISNENLAVKIIDQVKHRRR
jgi:flagellar motor switch protein FliM